MAHSRTSSLGLTLKQDNLVFNRMVSICMIIIFKMINGRQVLNLLKYTISNKDKALFAQFRWKKMDKLLFKRFIIQENNC